MAVETPAGRTTMTAVEIFPEFKVYWTAFGVVRAEEADNVTVVVFYN